MLDFTITKTFRRETIQLNPFVNFFNGVLVLLTKKVLDFTGSVISYLSPCKQTNVCIRPSSDLNVHPTCLDNGEIYQKRKTT